MRCKNCGWENPNEYAKCEKCNVPISDDAFEESAPIYERGPEELHIHPTIAGFAPDEFHPQATITGCAACGYAVRSIDAECPSCGKPVPGFQKEPEDGITENKKQVAAGTIIRGVNGEKEKNDSERKKLIGFLVSYSHSPNGEYFPLFEGKNFIGRAASSNVSIQGDSSISDKHLSILYRAVDRKFKFKDEQSSNGTFINEVLTDEGELNNLDMIRIGTTRLLFWAIPLSAFE